jgi:hypothetical protein
MTQITISQDHPQFAAVLLLLAGTADVAAPPKSEPAADAPAAEKKPRTTKASATAASGTTADTTTKADTSADTSPPGAPSAGDAEANALAYTEVKKRILALSEKDREAVVSVLKTYGVAKGSELTPDQYPAVIADLDGALMDEPDEDLS